VYVSDQPINLRAIFLYTEIPILWEIYEDTVGMNPPSDGGFNLLALDTAIKYGQHSEYVQLTHRKNMLAILKYFLMRANTRLAEKRRLAALQQSEG